MNRLIDLVDGQKWMLIKIVQDLLWPSLSTVVSWGYISVVYYLLSSFLQSIPPPQACVMSTRSAHCCHNTVCPGSILPDDNHFRRCRANETRSKWTRSIFSVPMRRVPIRRVPMRRVPNRRVYYISIYRIVMLMEFHAYGILKSRLQGISFSLRGYCCMSIIADDATTNNNNIIIQWYLPWVTPVVSGHLPSRDTFAWSQGVSVHGMYHCTYFSFLEIKFCFLK